jgi:hypothetical protein
MSRTKLSPLPFTPMTPRDTISGGISNVPVLSLIVTTGVTTPSPANCLRSRTVSCSISSKPESSMKVRLTSRFSTTEARSASSSSTSPFSMRMMFSSA